MARNIFLWVLFATSLLLYSPAPFLSVDVFAETLPATPLYQKNGAAASDRLGWSVASAGDVNGDGRADFIVGAISADPAGVSYAGSAFIYSGATGTLLYQKDGAAPDDALGYSVASAGDVNGDGKDDFIVGAIGADPGEIFDAGSAFVYSGATGSLLYQKDGATPYDFLGFSVASAGDVNGDGRADFIIGTYAASPGGLSLAGSAFVYSGATGALLYQNDGTAAGDFFGFSVASAGDVNGDGKADFIIGAKNADPDGLDGAGSAYVYSGIDGALLYQKKGAAAGDNLGMSAAGAGDVNGDGGADFICGAFSASPGGDSGAGSAFVYSGATGGLLYQKDGAASYYYLGRRVASAGDVNGDGRVDFIIGAMGADPDGLSDAGSAYVYSGATGTLLYQRDGTAAYDYLGYSVAPAGDVNGDGRADIIIGAYGASPGGLSGAGSAYVYGLCSAAKGDIDGDASLAPADVVLMLNCIYLATGNCDLCFADVTCDGNLSPADVVKLLNMVYLGEPVGC